MVIAKAEWFKRRKYTGWGVTPKTWQGWVYILLVIAPLIIFQLLPYWNVTTRSIVTLAWILFLVIDIFEVMLKMKNDEREKIHEAISERNALWAIMAVLVISILYQLIKGALNQTVIVDWFIIIALFVGIIVKAVSNIYLDKKN